MIRTDRLELYMASDVSMKAAFAEMLAGCKADPDQRKWYAVWFIRLKSGEIIGDYCFKGLSEDGVVEIGYGLYPTWWGKGYATEAVIAAVNWAYEQPGVKMVEAETDIDNLASKRVLEKVGFVPNGKMGEEGPRFVWKEKSYESGK